MNKAIVIQLTPESLEISCVEVFWENSLGKGFSGMENKEAPAPFNDTSALFLDEHVAQSTNEFVKSQWKRTFLSCMMDLQTGNVGYTVLYNLEREAN